MTRLIVAYLAAGAAFAALDFLWLGFAAKGLYQREIGSLLAQPPNWVAAIAFYLIYLAGVVFFAVRPAENWTAAALYGAAFGFVAYATYDLTNMATLKGFSWTVVFADLAWGTAVTAAIAAIGHLAAGLVSR